MVWELRYTSAESGPTGRSGFQFVDITPGTPPEVTRAVTPYMIYRPPPGAPSAPDPGELSAFPVSLAYGEEGGYAVLVRCRYTGRDYSGRYGNFLGHAVVATAEEMAGLRPIELWDSPIWDGAAPAGELMPGDAFDPDALVGWLAAEGGYDRLAALLDAVARVLTDGHGRVVLVAEDAGLIARWIAVLSYSLPAELAARLSFVTYTADPDAAPQAVVGTVPEAWPGRGFRLDEPAPDTRAGRFARVITDCWRTGDLGGIDSVGEVIAIGARHSSTEGMRRSSADGAPGSLMEAAAALLALCRGDTDVSAAEQAAAAALVRDRGAPGWVWPGLAAAVPTLGFEPAAALAGVAPEVAEHCVRLALKDASLRARLPALRLCDGLPGEFRAAMAAAPDLTALAEIVRLADRVGGRIEPRDLIGAAAACARRGAGEVAAALRRAPDGLRREMAAGVVAGLEAAEPPVRAALLTADACAALGDHDWTRAPRTGGLVLAARADRRTATVALIDLEPHGLPDLDDLLGVLWAAPPTADDCRWLIERLDGAMPRFAALRVLTRRVFETAPLEAAETVRLAELIRDRLPALAGPARAVLAHGAVLRAVADDRADDGPDDRADHRAGEDGVYRGRDAGTDATGATGVTWVTGVSGVTGGQDVDADERIARLIAPLDAADPVTGRVLESLAGALARRSARSRAAVLAAVPAVVRAALAGHWVAAGPGRAGRVDLAEIEVRLDRAGAATAPLTAWADDLGRFARRGVESALTGRDPDLAAAWRRLRRREA